MASFIFASLGLLNFASIYHLDISYNIPYPSKSDLVFKKRIALLACPVKSYKSVTQKLEVVLCRKVAGKKLGIGGDIFKLVLKFVDV